MVITGLTERELTMLNTMWSLETYDDLIEWQSSLSDADFRLSVSLQQLLLFQALDEIIEDSDVMLDDAMAVIAAVKKKLH